MIKLIINTKSFKNLDEDDKNGFLSILEEDDILSSYNRNAFISLIENDFSEKDQKMLLDKFPDIYAGVPKITTEELKNLATLKFKDVIKTYITTGKIPKGFESFEKDLKKGALIEKKGALIKEGEELDRKAKKAKEIEELMDGIIKKMEKMS